MNARGEVRVMARLFARQGGARLLLGAVLGVFTVLAGIALMGLSGWFITAAALAGGAAVAGAAFNVFLPSAGIRLLALGRTAGRYGERVVTHDATLAVLAGLREQLFRGWAEPGAARALARRPARLLFRLTQDVDALDSIYLRLLVPLLAAAGAALFVGAAFGWLDWRLGLITAGSLLLAGLVLVVVVARRAGPFALRRAVGLERLRAGCSDLVAGQTELAMAGRLAAQCASLMAVDARLVRADAALDRLATRADWLVAVAGQMLLAATLVGVGWLVGNAFLALPVAVLVLLVVLAALEPFAALRRGAVEAARSGLAARRLAPRLRAAAAGSGPASPDRQPVARPAEPDVALAMAEVCATHPGRRLPALQVTALRVRSGERLALVGPSGAGKSTLLALAAGELAPQSGRVEAQPCTWLTQRTELFQDSVRDNLKLAHPHASDEALWAALQAGGLATDIARLPQGLDTPLGEGGLGLSGGQSRRLALARLLLHPARFWLLDEPTEGLDPDTAADVLARLARQVGGRTVLVATHLRREAELADRLVAIDGGRIVADWRRGTPGFDAALETLRQS